MSTQNPILPLIQMATPKKKTEFERLNMPALQYPQEEILGANISPQVVDVSPQGIAGAERPGVDWRNIVRTLGSYLSAAGEGMIGKPTLSQGLAGAVLGASQNLGNIRNYQAMSPYLKEMGIDTSYLDPRRGGQGINATPQELIKLKSDIDYRNRSLDTRELLGLLTNERQRADLVQRLLNSGNLTPEEAQGLLGGYGINTGNLGVSNQTRNADVNEQLAPAKQKYYESLPILASGRLGLQQQESDVNTAYKNMQMQKMNMDMNKAYLAQQQKADETLNNIGYTEQLIKNNPNLVGVYSPATATLGRYTGGNVGMSKAELATRGEIARAVGTIKNDLIAQARANGQTSINTMSEINQATAGLDENLSAEELLGALKTMRNIAQRIQKIPSPQQQFEQFVPNADLTPIPTRQITPKQVTTKKNTTSKPKVYSF